MDDPKRTWGRSAMAVVVVGMIAACSTASGPSAAPVPTPADGVTASPISTAQASPSPVATDARESSVPSSIRTGAAVPAKPTGVSFGESRKGEDPSSTEITQTVRWEGPRSHGIEIRVYGVTECVARPAYPAPRTHGPCLVEHTPLPASLRTPLAAAPASDGVVSWTWTGTFDCHVGLAYDPRGPAYYSVVLSAYSATDHSIFAIAEPGSWSQPGPDDIVC